MLNGDGFHLIAHPKSADFDENDGRASVQALGREYNNKKQIISLGTPEQRSFDGCSVRETNKKQQKLSQDDRAGTCVRTIEQTNLRLFGADQTHMWVFALLDVHTR